MDVTIRYVDLDSNEVLMEHGPTTLEADDPLASVDLTVRVPFLPVPHEGGFALEVHASDELIGMLRIIATKIEEREGEEEDNHE